MPLLSVVAPAYCEAENVEPLFQCLVRALEGYDWELILVDDDSPDGTAEKARELAQTDPRLRVIQRIHRRGLAGAVIEGILSSSAPYVAVIDADMQHDENALPKMIEIFQAQPEIELIIGTRYGEGGGLGDWAEDRRAKSKLATKLGAFVVKSHTSDPMSGFFAVRRDVFLQLAPDLSDQGFKILLDLMATAPRPLRVAEVPYEFKSRQFGESKLDSAAVWQFLELFLEKTVGQFVPLRLIKFGLVGGSGVIIHMGTLLGSFKVLGLSFMTGQVIATIVAMTWNYFLNNVFTFKDQRLTGARALIGLLSFYAVCAVGAVANVGVASYIFQRDTVWWIAGIAGILVGTVWNYAVSSRLTWGRKRRRAKIKALAT